MNITLAKTLVTLLLGAIFFSGLTLFMEYRSFWSFNPLFFIKLLLLCVAAKILLQNVYLGKSFHISQLAPLISWMLFYLLVSILWYAFIEQTEEVTQVLRQRILGVTLVLLFVSMLYDDMTVLTRFRWMLLAGVLLAVVNNVIDFFAPFTFVPLGSPLSNPGRAAGFYLNANGAGGALILGMILTIGLLKPRYRTAYALLVLVGVMLTFSRSGQLGWLLVFLILVAQKVLNTRQAILGLVLTAFALSQFLLIVPDLLKKNKDVNVRNVQERIDWVTNPVDLEDSSAKSRKEVAARAWQMFADRPLLGHGLGATVVWDEIVSPHNMYLSFMADHGVIGLLILPLFALATVWRARGEARLIAVPFVLFILFWGIFSHNVIDEYHVLVSFAVMASLCIQSRHLIRGQENPKGAIV